MIPVALDRVADRPTWLLARAHERARGLLHAAFAGVGVRGYDYRVLAALDQVGPASQADLGRAARIDRSDVVAVLGDLTGRGWVRRDQDPADRRRNVVSLTASGSAALLRLDAVVDAVQAEVTAALDDAERRTLLALLAKVAAGPSEDQTAGAAG